MIAHTYINGIDIGETYGVHIAENGYNKLMEFPSLKAPEIVDWAERNGIDADLTNPKLNSKIFTIPFVTDKNADVEGFLQEIYPVGYHYFMFEEIQHERTLRLVSTTEHAGSIKTLRAFNLEFCDDFPAEVDGAGYLYMAPLSAVDIPQSGYKIDGVDLKTYGIAILEGTDTSILKPHSIKQNLNINSQLKHGAQYDTGRVKYKAKQVTINCCMFAKTLPEFWRNYNSFLYNISKAGERTLTEKAIGWERANKFYYESSAVETVAITTGNIWFQFSLNIVFTLS